MAEHVQHIWERLGLASLSQCKHIRVPEASGDPESGKVCGLSILQIFPLPSNILFILSTGSSCRCTQSSPCPTHLELPKCQLSLHSLHCSFSLALRFPAMLLGRHATSVRSTGYVITTSLVYLAFGNWPGYMFRHTTHSLRVLVKSPHTWNPPVG